MTRLLVVCLALLAFLACDRAKDEAAETVLERAIRAAGREGTVDVDRKSGTIRLDLGSAVRPSGWPEDVPVYPKARRLRVKVDDGSRTRLSVWSDDPVESVAAFYRERLAAAGWRIRGGDRREEVAADKDGRHLTATFDPERRSGGSRVEIVVGRAS
jgi:hypothetical protein